MTRVFALPGKLAAKDDPALIARDEKHFATLAGRIQGSIDDLAGRLETVRRAPAGKGRQAVDRDEEVRRLTSRLRLLRRYGVDLCLGQMVGDDDPEPVYIGRRGLTDGDGRRLLLDWRSPAAEPFFGATHANPMGLVFRRRYRWTGGRITDYWDEVFDAAGFAGHAAALDDQSAFLASLGGARTARMRDVLGTIQADQDAIIRAGSKGALVVDGGPGTGKTVVALHRTAYLLYSDPRLGNRRGGVLFVGPHEPYLAYVGDVLPSLGEDDVQTCMLRDLVPEGAAAVARAEPLKETVAMVRAVEAAIRFYEEPPASEVTISTEEAEVTVTPRDWAAAFEAAEPGTPHNEAREPIVEELAALLADRHDMSETSLRRHLRPAVHRAWPLLDAADIVGDLWSVPAYLRRCAPWLTPEEVEILQRDDPKAWTTADLPLLDAARQRLGDANAEQRHRRRQAEAREGRQQMDRVLDDLIASSVHDDGEGLMKMLVQQDLRDNLADGLAAPDTGGPELLAGPFAHIVVDEAQELTDAEWQMLLLRCPSRSFTIVGDRAQARNGFTESWRERLERVGFDRVEMAALTVNYRTPQEVMAEAEPVIRAVLPDANVPTSIRRGGLPVEHRRLAELDEILAGHDEGIACVISATAMPGALTPELAKGLEFDLVVLVEPEKMSAVDRYVAMTRATRRLVVLTR
ncbi:DNA helicase [Actinoplanes sp. OR16]|uniref:RNA polymerase recycling motor ATPase HelR n=1 Tax=Actinoplanes sp. OR16 TaxID=946334 RepID=UPI000F70902A|nr:RNA polymerase recycling motor ATPase HelR [Actinoplanes sp. OR16]BBH70398.1 DNA helicase [Actinoplanes sp. OR16]